MIYILYKKFEAELNVNVFNHYLQELPKYMQTRILKYKKWQDAQSSLLGKILLQKGLQHLRLDKYSLKNLKLDDYQKPYLDEYISFNISHTDNYVICALSVKGMIGIDIEKIKAIKLDDFRQCFSEREWRDIMQEDDSYKAFYKYWTKKEAFVKAVGKGLHISLEKIDVVDNKIIWDNKMWFLNEIKIDNEYVIHLASDFESPVTIVEDQIITYVR